ncbi:hypothetical protein PENSPDRAFT_382629 [Peniophora sp. CONT]|nr:hypothetical protein PENSPDRAFT_382629 [Peniophora sp. CONT]
MAPSRQCLCTVLTGCRPVAPTSTEHRRLSYTILTPARSPIYQTHSSCMCWSPQDKRRSMLSYAARHSIRPLLCTAIAAVTITNIRPQFKQT